jgi:hypothetical protein
MVVKLFMQFSTVTFIGFRRVCKNAKNGNWIRHARQSILPHGTTKLVLDGRSLNLIFVCFFLKSFKKIHILLKWTTNNGYFAGTATYISDHISLKCSYNEKCFRRKL